MFPVSDCTCIFSRSSCEKNTRSGVNPQTDPHSASMTELWPTSYPTGSRPDPHMDDIAPLQPGYHPLNRAHQPLSKDETIVNREQIKPQYQRESRGENASTCTRM